MIKRKHPRDFHWKPVFPPCQLLTEAADRGIVWIMCTQPTPVAELQLKTQNDESVPFQKQPLFVWRHLSTMASFHHFTHPPIKDDPEV